MCVCVCVCVCVCARAHMYMMEDKSINRITVYTNISGIDQAIANDIMIREMCVYVYRYIFSEDILIQSQHRALLQITTENTFHSCIE